MSLIKWRKNDGTVPSLPSLTGWVDNFFGDNDEMFNFWNNRWNREMTIPAVNVEETEKAFNLEVAAPGMKKEDFKVEIEKSMLRISAEAKVEKEDKKDDYTRKEFNYQSFSRSFWLPENVLADEIKANYKDGVLKITLPKTEVEDVESPKMIEIA